MAIDLGRESIELVFYEAPISKKDKLINDQLQSYSTSYGVNRYEQVYNESNEMSSMYSNPRSLSDAIQSSRVLLYGDLSVQSTRTQETQMTYAEEDTVIASSENTASQQIGMATKRKQLISIGVSNKRPKLPSPLTFKSFVVCSSLPVKVKPGKKCTGCKSWIHNKCARLHAPLCNN